MAGVASQPMRPTIRITSFLETYLPHNKTSNQPGNNGLGVRNQQAIQIHLLTPTILPGSWVPGHFSQKPDSPYPS